MPHLLDFIAHAEMVYHLYLQSGHQLCWTEGCSEFYFNDVLLLAKQVQPEEPDRQTVIEEIRKIWPTVSFEVIRQMLVQDPQP